MSGIARKFSLRFLEFFTRISLVKFILFMVIALLGYYYINAFIEFGYISRYYAGIIVLSLIFIIMAISLNVATGFLGQLVLGHAGFMAVGAYTAALFAVNYKGQFEDIVILLVGAAIAMVSAGIMGLIVGFPALRLKGDYLGIMTLGFGEIIRVVLVNLEITNGSQGLTGIPRILNFTNAYIAVVFTLVVVVLIMKSRHGRAILSIRENEIASENVGINLTKYKLMAFVIAASFGGLGGALFAFKDGFLAPASFGFVKSVEIFVIVVLGGMGSLTGSIIAAVFVVLLPEVLRTFESYRMLTYSLVLILTMLFRPQGLFGTREFSLGFLNKPFRKWNDKFKKLISDGNDDSLIRTLDDRTYDGPILQADNISITFGGLKAVEDFSINIGDNELVGLIGPNGAGKTTIFNMITGVYKPTEGEIFLNGKKINNQKPSKIVQLGSSRTFQNIRLFENMTVIDNIKIAFHNEMSYGVLRSLFKVFGFVKQEQRAETVSLELLKVFDLDQYKDELAKNLPYGKQRKLEIARALATNPRILYLDEPAAGMNPQETEELMSTINLIKDRFNISILLIEHDMKLVMGICERLVVIDYGKVIARGKPNEIKNNRDVIKAYLGE